MYSLTAHSFIMVFKPNPGDFGGEVLWEDAFNHLWERDKNRILNMIDDLVLGVSLQPVEVWNDGIVRNGHHRIAAHIALNKPIRYVRSDKKEEE